MIYAFFGGAHMRQCLNTIICLDAYTHIYSRVYNTQTDIHTIYLGELHSSNYLHKYT